MSTVSPPSQEPSAILVVEDEENLIAPLRYNLEREGYLVETATDGGEALGAARARPPSMIILDIMLPTMDGIQVCRILRTESRVPILMLTAKGEEVDKVVGLDMGDDDYMTKPFGMRELVARVKAMLRRAEHGHPLVDGLLLPRMITRGGFRIDVHGRQVFLDGVPVPMKPKEFDLLTLFAGNPGKAFTRDHILDRVWGSKDNIDQRTVDVHVRWIRQKIEDGSGSPKRIFTIRGHGYRFEG